MTELAANYNIHEAKTQLSRIVERVEHGEEVTICRSGVPVARVVPIQGHARRRGRGMLRGRIDLAQDWDAPELAEVIADDFEGVP